MPLFTDSFGSDADNPSEVIASSRGNSQRTSRPNKRPRQDTRQSQIDQQLVADYISLGRQALANNQLADAEISFVSALRIDPNSSTAHHLMAQVGDLQQDFRAAEFHYLQALTQRPNDPDLLSDMGYSYLQQNRLREAKGKLSAALRLAPNHRMATINLAAVHAYEGNPSKAMAYLRSVSSEEQAQQILANVMRNAPQQTETRLASNSQVEGESEAFQDLRAQMEAARQESLAQRQRQQALEQREMRDRMNRVFGPTQFGARGLQDGDLNRMMSAIDRDHQNSIDSISPQRSRPITRVGDDQALRPNVNRQVNPNASIGQAAQNMNRGANGPQQPIQVPNARGDSMGIQQIQPDAQLWQMKQEWSRKTGYPPDMYPGARSNQPNFSQRLPASEQIPQPQFQRPPFTGSGGSRAGGVGSLGGVERDLKNVPPTFPQSNSRQFNSATINDASNGFSASTQNVNGAPGLLNSSVQGSALDPTQPKSGGSSNQGPLVFPQAGGVTGQSRPGAWSPATQFDQNPSAAAGSTNSVPDASQMRAMQMGLSVGPGLFPPDLLTPPSASAPHPTNAQGFPQQPQVHGRQSPSGVLPLGGHGSVQQPVWSNQSTQNVPGVQPTGRPVNPQHGHQQRAIETRQAPAQDVWQPGMAGIGPQPSAVVYNEAAKNGFTQNHSISMPRGIPPQVPSAQWNFQTQAPHQQSGIRTAPTPMNSAWQNGALSSPTLNPAFAQGRVENRGDAQQQPMQ